MKHLPALLLGLSAASPACQAHQHAPDSPQVVVLDLTGLK